jgi:hypothetical protein
MLLPYDLYATREQSAEIREDLILLPSSIPAFLMKDELCLPHFLAACSGVPR